MQQPLLASEFDAAAVVEFGKIDKNRRGGKTVYVGPRGNPRGRVVVQTPAMTLPFGVTTITDPGTGEVQGFGLDVSYRTKDSDPEVEAFLRANHGLDAHVLETAAANSKEWFGKAMSKDLLDQLYRKLVKEPSNPAYAQITKLKVLSQKDGVTGDLKALTEFYDENLQPVDIDYVTRGCTVKCIVELSSVWFINKNSFGVTWRVLKCAVVSKPSNRGYDFRAGAAPAAAPSADQLPVEL